MISIKIDFHCRLCGNNRDFYCMPCKEKINNKDYKDSLTNFELKCKKCRKSYILGYHIKMV